MYAYYTTHVFDIIAQTICGDWLLYGLDSYKNKVIGL